MKTVPGPMRAFLPASILSLMNEAHSERGRPAARARSGRAAWGAILASIVALLIEQYGTDANIRYSFTAPVELGAMAGLGPFIFPPFEESIYPNMSYTFGLLMAKAGVCVRLPFSILPWIVLTPELSGAVRWEFQYDRERYYVGLAWAFPPPAH